MNKGEGQRQAIINSADKLFYIKGFESTSYAAIAKDCKIPKGNFYYYFKSKDEILLSVIQSKKEQFKSLLSGWDSTNMSPYQKLNKFISMVEGNSKSTCVYGCPIGTLNSELGKESRELQKYAKELFEIFIIWIAQQFETFLDKKTSRSKAEYLMVMAEGAALMAHAYKKPSVLKNSANEIRKWLATEFNIK